MRDETLVTDSARFRRRLLRLFENVFANNKPEFGHFLERETGAKIPHGSYGFYWSRFFEASELRDLLDTITVAHKFLFNQRNIRLKEWHREIKRFLTEESIGFRLDEEGGLHPIIDVEFERLRHATLRGLSNPRYAAVLASFEAAFDALKCDPPNTREAIRQIFDANEIAFKLLLGTRVSRLGESEIKKFLSKISDHHHEGTARSVAKVHLDSFAKWTSAAHSYRHGQGVEKPETPPLPLTISLVGAGINWLRLLLDLDRAEGNISANQADAD